MANSDKKHDGKKVRVYTSRSKTDVTASKPVGPMTPASDWSKAGWRKRLKAMKEAYAGGATISHNHGNPARDLTPDTKVSTAHRPGRSSSRPGTATPPSYGIKARDLTKNSNPMTKHKPLTPGRIREESEPKELRDIIEAKNPPPSKGKGHHGYTFGRHGKRVKVYIPTRDEADKASGVKKESVEDETINALMEMYDVPNVVGSSKEAQRLQDFSHHANEYHYNKRMSDHHHKISGDHEEKHGVTHLGEHHYYMHKAHESKMKHHSEHLAKEHGMDRRKMADLCWKHRDSAHDFTLALAQEGKEPPKQSRPNRGRRI